MEQSTCFINKPACGGLSDEDGVKSRENTNISGENTIKVIDKIHRTPPPEGGQLPRIV